MTFSVVDLPKECRPSKYVALIEQAAKLEIGKAISIDVKSCDVSIESLRSQLSAASIQKGIHIRTRSQGKNTLLVWRKNQSQPTPASALPDATTVEAASSTSKENLGAK